MGAEIKISKRIIVGDFAEMKYDTIDTYENER